MINDNDSPNGDDITRKCLPSQFSKMITLVSDDARDYGMVNSNEVILLPAKSIVTLYK